MTESDQVQETAIKSTVALKKEADGITLRRTLYAAGAGLLPFPVVDAALLMGIQITMVRSISNVYGVEFKENVVKSIIGSLVGSIGTAGVIKAIPIVGTAIGGLTAATVGAAATYGLGKVFTQHFDQGGTLLNFDPVASREYFQKEFEAGHLLVSDVAEVEDGVEKEKRGFFGNLFTSKKKQQEQAEREEIIQTNKALMESIAELKSEISALKKA
ncbi:MAG: hypothetical protein RIQ78_715 [Bacteroidota bacterium]|jgi:uncharacterized protein (DUF697 family)